MGAASLRRSHERNAVRVSARRRLWASHDHGQTFEWINRDIAGWGFNESPTSLCVSPDGQKMRIFSSDHSGFSLDGGKTWKYMNFKIAFGFEDGHVNWHGDGKTIVARSHTWPHPRMWLSRDEGQNFAEYSPEITQQISTQSIALMDDDVLLFQAAKLMRTEDYGKTLTEMPQPEYNGPDGKSVAGAFLGVSRRFQGKVVWLNATGVYTSGDKGKTWTIVGQTFPRMDRKTLGAIGPAVRQRRKSYVGALLAARRRNLGRRHVLAYFGQSADAAQRTPVGLFVRLRPDRRRAVLQQPRAQRRAISVRSTGAQTMGRHRDRALLRPRPIFRSSCCPPAMA